MYVHMYVGIHNSIFFYSFIYLISKYKNIKYLKFIINTMYIINFK